MIPDMFFLKVVPLQIPCMVAQDGHYQKNYLSTLVICSIAEALKNHVCTFLKHLSNY